MQWQILKSCTKALMDQYLLQSRYRQYGADTRLSQPLISLNSWCNKLPSFKGNIVFINSRNLLKLKLPDLRMKVCVYGVRCKMSSRSAGRKLRLKNVLKSISILIQSLKIKGNQLTNTNRKRILKSRVFSILKIPMWMWSTLVHTL